MNKTVRSARPLLGTMAKMASIGALAAAAACVARERRRIDFKGKVVLISGGSRGLGLELARAFANEGAELVLVARAQENLQRAAKELAGYGTRVLPFVCDISDRASVQEVVAKILTTLGRIDVLINNAGTIQVGPMENMELADYERAMAVHFWGPLYLIEEIIPHMKAFRHGRIVNISSIGGKIAVPHLLPYAASKFALVGLSEGMRSELIKHGIYVTAVCPGLMRTGSHLHAFFKGQHEKEYALFSLTNASPLLSTSSQSAAREIVEACRYGKAEIIITPQARLLRFAKAVFPTLTAETLGLLARLLPGARQEPGANQAKEGWKSQSLLAPALLTRTADRAAAHNNEIYPAGNASGDGGASPR